MLTTAKNANLGLFSIVWLYSDTLDDAAVIILDDAMPNEHINQRLPVVVEVTPGAFWDA
jgi:hypothetical protein